MPTTTHDSDRHAPATAAVSEEMRETIGLVLAEGYPLLLEGMEHAFTTDRGFQVLATCATGDVAVRAVVRHQPDVLVLDLDIQGDAFSVLRELAELRPATRVVVLAASVDENTMLKAMQLGARGIVLKNMARHLLVQCVRKVHRGGTWVEKASMARAIDQLVRHEIGNRDAAALLSPRELEIARLVAAGWSNKEIAGKLNICDGTVKVHLHHVYEKLGVRGRLELTLYARERALVSPLFGDSLRNSIR